jgi:hypothetical protein
LDLVALVAFIGCAVFSTKPVNWRDEADAWKRVGIMMASVFVIAVYIMKR